MNEFKVGDKVRIKNVNDFTDYPEVAEDFKEAGYCGRIKCIDVGMPFPIVVETADKSAHEFFNPHELERIEDSP